MTRDLNRKISKIQYNSLNLPATITYTDGHKVMNTYDCLGRKVSVIYQVSIPSVTTPQADGSSVTSNYYRTYMRRSYSGNCIYRNDTLERILTTTGYITPEGEYHHYLKDYQGNNRMVLNESGQTIERTDYYPYGMPFADTEHHQPYKYSGKELETMNGQRHLDYGARWMDYPIGRFTTIDRYCEKYYNLSPYLYCAGNPINNIDINGDSIAVLLTTKKLVGHIALLIQNENYEWRYYSVNGDDKNSSGNHIGGKETDDINQVATNPQNYIDKGNDDYEYECAFIIPTDKETDKAVAEKFEQESNKQYNLFSQNCATAVSVSLNSAGVNIQPHDIDLPPSANSVRGFESKGNSIIPVILYNEIKTKLRDIGVEIYKR